jgi:hypothetical protein
MTPRVPQWPLGSTLQPPSDQSATNEPQNRARRSPSAPVTALFAGRAPGAATAAQGTRRTAARTRTAIVRREEDGEVMNGSFRGVPATVPMTARETSLKSMVPTD